MRDTLECFQKYVNQYGIDDKAEGTFDETADNQSSELIPVHNMEPERAQSYADDVFCQSA